MSLDVNKLFNRRNNQRFNRMVVGDVPERLRLSRPDHIAVEALPGAYAYSTNQKMTYQDFDWMANQVANRLREAGLQRGDRVLFVTDNSSEALSAKFGVAKAGLVNVPVNPKLAADVMEHIIQLTDPAYVIIDNIYEKRFVDLFASCGLAMNVSLPLSDSGSQADHEFADWLEGASTTAPEVDLHSDDIWEILFTSGTTAMPKGAMISHTYSYLAGYNYGMHFSRGLDQPSQYKILSSLPVIYHVADHTLTFSAFFHGGSLVLGRRHDARQMAAAITDYQPTALWSGSANLLESIVEAYDKDPASYDFESLTSVLYGYSALQVATHYRLLEICSDRLQLWNSFAQTEVIAGTRFYNLENEDLYLADSGLVNHVGSADPSLAMKIVDEKGREIQTPEVAGQAVYQSPVAFSGYYKNETATQDAVKNGWFQSGDSVYRREEGLYVMKGRIKDMIKTNGESVSASRVEAVLSGHPGVDQVAVIGLPDEVLGERVTAVVVKKADSEWEEDELISYGRKFLASFETPRRIIVTDQLPESVGGKIQKYKLVEQFKED